MLLTLIVVFAALAAWIAYGCRKSVCEERAVREAIAAGDVPDAWLRVPVSGDGWRTLAAPPERS